VATAKERTQDSACKTACPQRRAVVGAFYLPALARDWVALVIGCECSQTAPDCWATVRQRCRALRCAARTASGLNFFLSQNFSTVVPSSTLIGIINFNKATSRLSTTAAPNEQVRRSAPTSGHQKALRATQDCLWSLDSRSRHVSSFLAPVEEELVKAASVCGFQLRADDLA